MVNSSKSISSFLVGAQDDELPQRMWKSRDRQFRKFDR